MCNMTHLLWDDDFRVPLYFLYTSLYAPIRCEGMNVPQHTYRCTQNTQNCTYEYTHKVHQKCTKNTHTITLIKLTKKKHTAYRKKTPNECQKRHIHKHINYAPKTRVQPPPIPHTYRHPPSCTHTAALRSRRFMYSCWYCLRQLKNESRHMC